MRIHREGYPTLILTFIVLSAFALSVHFFVNFAVVKYFLYLVFAGLYIFFLRFFRIPNRKLLQAAGTVVSPCDGVVVVLEETKETEYFNDNRIQVSIFMSPFNVHINWIPIDGVIKYFKYHPGKFLYARLPKSSTENERTTTVIDSGNNKYLIRQIAGFVARRIVWYVKEGDNMKQTQQLGFIKFGSRVDVFFPVGTKLNVKPGDVVTGGITVLAQE